MFIVLHADGHFMSHDGHTHRSDHETAHRHLHNNELLNINDEETSEKKKSKNINVRAAIIHIIGDFVQSVGVLIAAILIKIKV